MAYLFCKENLSTLMKYYFVIFTPKEEFIYQVDLNRFYVLAENDVVTSIEFRDREWTITDRRRFNHNGSVYLVMNVK